LQSFVTYQMIAWPEPFLCKPPHLSAKRFTSVTPPHASVSSHLKATC
jgi:hypothetical protein